MYMLRSFYGCPMIVQRVSNTYFTIKFLEKKFKKLTVNIADSHCNVTGERDPPPKTFMWPTKCTSYIIKLSHMIEYHELN